MATKPHILHRESFPRSNSYDPDWVMDHQMGPNPLWLAEWLCGVLDLKPGMRVLDLGCGTALTSMFFAKEFDVQIWATDLWVHPDENWRRIEEQGLGDRVFPVRAEAHALPFAAGFFDAVISVDAYQYFGTDRLYLGYISRFLKRLGKIGIVVPGLMQSFDGAVPEHLVQPQANGVAFWEDECRSFLTAQEWRRLWERSGRISLQGADEMPDGWKFWRDFEVALEQSDKNRFPSVAEALDRDQGRYLGFVRLVGIRENMDDFLNLYDPGVISTLNKMVE